MKVCSVCNENKELTEFYKQKKHSKTKGEWIYYNPECKECTKNRSVNWYKDNPENFKENRKRYSAKPETKEMVKTNNITWRNKGGSLDWQRRNKDKLKKYAFKRLHKAHTITKDEWNQCKEYFNNECAYCGLSEKEHRYEYNQQLHKEHVDHNGSNGIENCVPSCKVCNSSKKINILEEWYTIDNPNYSVERLNKIYEWLNKEVKILITSN